MMPILGKIMVVWPSVLETELKKSQSTNFQIKRSLPKANCHCVVVEMEWEQPGPAFKSLGHGSLAD